MGVEITANVSDGAVISSNVSSSQPILADIGTGPTIIADIATGGVGPAGAAGVGVPTGGTAGQVLSKIDGTDYNTQWVTGGGGGGGSGDVVGPTSSTDNAVVRFDATTGKLIQNSTVTISDTGNIVTSGTVDGRDVSTDGTRLDVITDANYLNSNTTKAQVGLSNVDNTSDANKPISTATQTALNGKYDEIAATTGNIATFATSGTTVADSGISAATLSSQISDLYANKQNLDADLTTISGLTATTDNFMQAKAGAWASRTVAQVKTDLGLTGTNSGDQTSIVGITGTKAQFDTAVTDGNILYVGDVTQYTDEQAQDATGAMAANSTFVSLAYVDATPSLTPSLSATGTPSATTFLRGDNTWATPSGGGSATIAQTTIDFGSTEKSDEVFAITDAAISATSKVLAFVTWVSSLGRDPDEIMADPIAISIEPLAGTMNIYAMALQGTVSGKYAINYQIG